MRSRISLILFSSIFFFWAFSLSAKHQVALFNYYHDLIIQKAYEMQLEDPGSQKAEDLINFCSFHRTLKEARFRVGGYYSFTVEEKEILENIAKTESPVSYNAIAVLNWLNRGADDWIVEPVLELQNSVIQNEPEIIYVIENNISFSVQPNPFNEETYLKIEGLSDTDAGYIYVSDITGKNLLEKAISKNNAIIPVSVNDLVPGIYFSGLWVNENFISCKKIIYAK